MAELSGWAQRGMVHRLRKLIVVRWTVAFVFLTLALGTRQWFALSYPLTWLVILAALTVLPSFLHLYWLKRGTHLRELAYAQVVLDVGILTAGLYITGLAEFSFDWIYVVIISASAYLLGMNAGFITATLSIILYALLLTTEHLGFLPPYRQPGPLGSVMDFQSFVWRYLPLALSGRVILFYLAGFLPGYLLKIEEDRRQEQDRALQKLREEAEVRAALLEIARVVSSAATLDELLRTITMITANLLGADRCSAYLLNETKTAMVAAQEYGTLPSLRSPFHNLDFESGTLPFWAQEVLKDRKPIIIEDARESSLVPSHYVENLGLKSLAVLPLLSKGEVMGAILVVYARTFHSFSFKEMAIASSIASQVAVAVENLKLLDQVRSTLNKTALLYQLSGQLHSTLPLEERLKLAVADIVDVFEAQGAMILILDGEERVELKVGTGLGLRRGRNGAWDFERNLLAPFRAGDPIVINDVEANPDAVDPYFLPKGVHALAALPLHTQDSMVGLLCLYYSTPRSFPAEELDTLATYANQATIAVENSRLVLELQRLLLETIGALADAVEAKDAYTAGHSENVTEYALAIGDELQLPPERLELLRFGALLHDIGKIGINDAILGKPGKLTEDEYEVIRGHASIGARIVERVELLREVVPIIYHHQEHYDGQGYPEGLAGEKIPLEARIIAVADGFEAMTSDRAYRKAMSPDEALAILWNGADKQWDGRIVEAMTRVLNRDFGMRQRRLA